MVIGLLVVVFGLRLVKSRARLVFVWVRQSWNTTTEGGGGDWVGVLELMW